MINKLILGTVQLGIPYGINNTLGKPDLIQANAILNLAKEEGITTLDTAKAYGNAMEVIGNYHRESGSTFKVISKFHTDKTNLKEDIKNELVLLAIKNFEGYLFHSFSDFENVDSATLKVLSLLKEESLINKIGVSVYGNDQFEKAINNNHIDIIQLPYNILDNAYQRGELMKKAKDNGKELHVRSVFLQGLFFMTRSSVPQKIEKLVPYLNHIKELAVSNSLTVHELALGYVLKNKLVDKVLIGVEAQEQLLLNIKALKKCEQISPHLFKEIDAIQVKEINLLSPANWN